MFTKDTENNRWLVGKATRITKRWGGGWTIQSRKRGVSQGETKPTTRKGKIEQSNTLSWLKKLVDKKPDAIKEDIANKPRQY